MKPILFIHNAIPEYRIPWFKKVNELRNTIFIFTNEKIIKKLYFVDTDFSMIKDLNYTLIGSGIIALKNTIIQGIKVKKYACVLFPPIDTFHELWISVIILLFVKIYKIPAAYFWEKWEAPEYLQPLSCRIKNKITLIGASIIFKSVEIVFAGSSSSKEYFIKHGVNEKKIKIIPNASGLPKCEFIDIKRKYNIKKEKKVILFFGRLLFQKGAYYLIKAFNKLNKNDYFLIIAGDGEDRTRCEEFIKKNKIINVIITGWIHPSMRKNFFDQCDIFVSPGIFYKGRTDVWGLTIIEAIESGKPIVATNAIGSAIDTIKNGINGYCINAMLKEESFVKALQESIKKAFFLRKKAYIYNKRLYKKYSFNEMTKIFISELNNIICDDI